MRLLLLNHIENAVDSLRSTRLRTGLTVLGVTIGIASITMIMSLSGGATKVITDQVEELGGNIAVVRPGDTARATQLDNIASPISHSYATSSLTEQDVSTISKTAGVQSAAPIMLVGGSVRAGNNRPSNTPIIATTPELINITNLAIRDGQFIDSVTNKDTAVVGAQLSVDLFGTEQSIGQTFKVRGQVFTVIGVLKPQNNPINYNSVDFDHAAVISLESGKAFNQGIAQIQQIDVKADTPEKLPAVLKSIQSSLSTNHKGEKDFMVLSGDEISRPTSELFYTLATTMSAVAAISLIVGGIGIMNIMLVSVTERTREIGIRKALGASNGSIASQFMIESMAMSLVGGVIGLLLGYGLAFIVSRAFLTFIPVFSYEIAGATLLVAFAVGTVFGLYPAVRASRKDPIQALRQYH